MDKNLTQNLLDPNSELADMVNDRLNPDYKLDQLITEEYIEFIRVKFQISTISLKTCYFDETFTSGITPLPQ